MNKPLFTMSAREFQMYIEQGIHQFCALLDDVVPTDAAVEAVARDVVTSALWVKQ